jgi:aryl-alcohol dehydrogenase-like predicted oxidoreductase
MEKRTLAGTNLEVSRVCLGTMTFGGQTDRPAAARMIDLAADRGVNFLDTANVYTGGESERILGEILGSRRHTFVLASKVRNKVGDEPPGLSRSAILAAVDKSLSRLRTDYLDIYYLHLPDRTVPIDESLEAMNILVKEGKVRNVASSNYAGWEVCQMLNIAARNGYGPARITQPMYNLIARRIEDEYLPMCQSLGVSTVVYNPLAGGLLTGKHSAAAPIPGSRFDGNKMYIDRYWNSVNFAAVARLSEIAASAARSLVSLSLNWLLRHTSADCIILGASKVEHLEANLTACEEGPLPPETLTACDDVWAMLRGAAPKYNR